MLRYLSMFTVGLVTGYVWAFADFALAASL
jgi:hypothetical protein